MDNEWKELEIDNLPTDILTGNYEFALKDMANIGCLKVDKILDLLGAVANGYEYRYRKPEPQQPSPEVREKYLEAVIGTYEELMRKSHDLNWKLLEDIKKLKSLAGYHDEQAANTIPKEATCDNSK